MHKQLFDDALKKLDADYEKRRKNLITYLFEKYETCDSDDEVIDMRTLKVLKNNDQKEKKAKKNSKKKKQVYVRKVKFGFMSAYSIGEEGKKYIEEIKGYIRSIHKGYTVDSESEDKMITEAKSLIQKHRKNTDIANSVRKEGFFYEERRLEKRDSFIKDKDQSALNKCQNVTVHKDYLAKDKVINLTYLQEECNIKKTPISGMPEKSEYNKYLCHSLGKSHDKYGESLAYATKKKQPVSFSTPLSGDTFSENYTYDTLQKTSSNIPPRINKNLSNKIRCNSEPVKLKDSAIKHQHMTLKNNVPADNFKYPSCSVIKSPVHKKRIMKNESVKFLFEKKSCYNHHPSNKTTSTPKMCSVPNISYSSCERGSTSTEIVEKPIRCRKTLFPDSHPSQGVSGNSLKLNTSSNNLKKMHDDNRHPAKTLEKTSKEQKTPITSDFAYFYQYIEKWCPEHVKRKHKKGSSLASLIPPNGFLSCHSKATKFPPNASVDCLTL